MAGCDSCSSDRPIVGLTDQTRSPPLSSLPRFRFTLCASLCRLLLAMSKSSSPVIKRSARTYGKSRKTSASDTSLDTSFELDFDPDSSTSSAYDFPPNSDAPDIPNASPHRQHSYADNDDDPSPQSENDASQHHFYGWKDQLRAIDKQFDSDPLTAPTVLATQDDPQAIHATHGTLLSDQDQPMPDAFSGSLPHLTPNSLLQSPDPISSRVLRRIPSSPVPEPDSGHESHRPSSPRSPLRHPIGTPRSGSSPTPPTSIEAMPKKGKGKGRAVEPRRSKSDDEAAGSSMPSKSSKAGGKGKKASGRVKVSGTQRLAHRLALPPTSLSP